MPRVINRRSFVRLCLCFAFLAFLTVVPKAANPLFVPVEWQTTANVTIASGVVTKTSGCDGCPDGSVLSTLLPTTGDVYVRFVPNATGTMVVGLIQDGTTLSASAFALGFQISADGYWEVREAGVWVAEGMAGPTDEFRIGLEGDQVRYYVSGHVVYSRNRAAGTTYRFAAIFSAMGAGLADAAVATTSVTSQPAYAPVLWTDAANLTVGGSTVTKTSGCDGCPDAFAVSGSQTGSQDAYLEFPAVLDKRIVVGFIPTGEAVSLGAIDYGVGFFADGGWDVREGDGYRVDGTTGQGDIFRIALEGTRVTYYRNGWPIWTSARRDGISYRAVVLDYSSGGTLGGADLAINSAPVISPPGTPHFALATPGSMAIGAVDPEHDVMTFSASGLPSGLSLNAYSGIIAGTPTSGGESVVSVTAADLHGGTNTISFTLVVDNTSPASTPTLTSVSPSSAAKGTQVTLLGTNFGTQANGAYVWLGTVPGTVVSWSATQIVARVDPDAATGVAQVRLPTGDSNTLSFAVAESSNCSYTLSPAAVTSGPEGATGTLAISTPSNCAWTASSPETWVTLSAVSGVGPATITYTIAVNSGIGRSATLTIGNASLLVSQSAAQPAAPPALSTVSPDSGVAGTQVTLSGSNFGAVQNGGSVWLGTRQASVVNWSDTSIAATVASGSTTGTAQVRRIDVASNALPFAVITAMISGVTPSSGPVGTAVTISGTGFGATQGASTVWFGSSPVTATSWSDTQIEATIPSNATAAGLTVLRAGVLSNSATFTVTGTAPRIDGIWPTSGGPGTTVFILGQGFGATQGVGSVLLGGAEAVVTTWSDSAVQVTVGNTALSGPLKLQQNGLWSNAKSFVIASASGASVTLSPNLFNLVVGESRSIQALDGLGADVPGLTWTSSNPGVVTVSNDPSPLITAVAPGTATIRAGDALAEVTVFAEGGMPDGTVLWSVPGPISGVSDIAVAVPAAGAIADVFAIGLEGEVQAITVDGTVAWTVPGPFGFGAGARSDFQGGLVVFKRDRMARLDPLTGQTTTLYANANAETVSNGLATPAIHPNGKVLTVDYTCHDLCDGQDADDSAGVVGIDLSSGSRAFRVPLANSTFTTTNVDSAFCGNADGDGTHTQQQHAWPNSQLTIAADGFAYMSYLTYHSTGTRQGAAQQPYPAAAYPLFEQMRAYSSARDWSNALATLDALLAAINEPNNSVAALLRGDYTSGDYTLAFPHENAWAPQFQRACNRSETMVMKLHLMRVNGDGQSSDVVAKEWTATDQINYTLDPNTRTYTSVELHSGPNDVDISEHIITHADQGALYSWQVIEQCSESGTFGSRTYTQVTPCHGPQDHLTVMNGSVVSDVTWQPGATAASGATEPLLQLADDSFVGVVSTASGATMIAFDESGEIRWSTPGAYPLIATATGILAATDAGTVEFDVAGSVSELQVTQETQSWQGNVYKIGSVERVASAPTSVSSTFWPMQKGNPAGTGAQSRKDFHVFLPVPAGILAADEVNYTVDQFRSLLIQQTENLFKAFPYVHDEPKATVRPYLNTLADRTVPMVAFIGHAVTYQSGVGSVGLRFTDKSLVKRTSPQQLYFDARGSEPKYNEFIDVLDPKAQVTFIASCEPGTVFRSLWSINESTQDRALVIPEGDESTSTDLYWSAQAWLQIAEVFSDRQNHPSIYDAVQAGNQWLDANARKKKKDALGNVVVDPVTHQPIMVKVDLRFKVIAYNEGRNIRAR